MHRIAHLLIIGILSSAALFGCASLEKNSVSSADISPESPGDTKEYTLDVKSLRDAQGQWGQLPKTDEAYIIVHPSYYVFFQKKPFHLAPSADKTLVELFTEMNFPSENTLLNLMKQYESMEMDFISTSKNENKLVILVVPGQYRRSRSYLYKSVSDEYARYLNSVASSADSVFYIESTETDSGKIAEKDMRILTDMLTSLGVQNVFVGGGYIGRCQEEFYRSFSKEWPENNMALIPELSAFSPRDLSDATARMLLTNELTLNTNAMNYFIRNGGIKSLGSTPALRNMSNHRVVLVSEKNNNQNKERNQ